MGVVRIASSMISVQFAVRSFALGAATAVFSMLSLGAHAADLTFPQRAVGQQR
jgi:hypothetical protein